VGKGAMTLSVKYFEEMEKQVKIPERDKKRQVNFSVYRECLVWIYSRFVSLQTLKNYLRVCSPLLISLCHFAFNTGFFFVCFSSRKKPKKRDPLIRAHVPQF